MSLFKGHSLPKTTLLSAASFLFCVLPALAQNGQIQGVLVDASGASIANAHVVLKARAKAQSLEKQTPEQTEISICSRSARVLMPSRLKAPV
jgi:hypothetical protein